MKHLFKKGTLLSFLMLYHYFFVLGQTAPVTLPPTPESQSLLKTVNMQVNKSTGIAGFSIPLCEAKEGGITLPVTLSYTCAAIKVRDIASWVGTGWNLSAGGKITRVIMDCDDLQGGYSRGQGATANNIAGWWNGKSVKDDRKDDHTGTPCTKCKRFDGEPDLFYYELPGRSGMFVLDYTGKAWTIPYANLKIELRSDDSFVITDESANQYYFTLKEWTYETSHSDREHTGTSGSPYGSKSEIQSYISTWHMTRVQDLAGEEMDLSYQSGSQISYENNSYTQFENETIEDKSVHFRTTPYYLQSISWSSGRLEFISTATRTDLAGCRQLDEIKIYSPSAIYRKSVKLTYSRFSSNRLRLDKVGEVSGNTSALIGKYEYYTDTNLPARNSKDMDHWGYYNGRGNTGWLPANSGCNREPSFSYTRANLIKKVYNSLGGTTEYEYEENRTADNAIVGGVRVKSVKTGDTNGNVETVTYTYSGGTSFNTSVIYSNAIGRKKLKYSYSTLNLHDTGGSNVYYGEVTENLSNGSKIISRYTTYTDCGDIRSADYINATEPNPNPEISLFPNSSRFWRRGLLKEEISKSAAGTEVKHVVNTYQFPANPKGRIKGFYLQSFSTAMAENIDHLVVYDWISEPLYLTTEVVTGLYALNTTRNVTFDTVYCHPVEETVNYENGDVYKTVISFPFSYAQRSNPAGFADDNAIDLLLSSGLKFVPIEKVEYKNGKVVGGSITTYRKCVLDGGKSIPVPDKQKTLISLPVTQAAFIPSVRNSVGRFVHDTRYETVRTFDNYGLKGKLLSWHNKNGIPQSIVYSPDETTPIASVENAAYAVPELAMVRDSVLRNYNHGSSWTFHVATAQNVAFRVKTLSLMPARPEYVLFLNIYSAGHLVDQQMRPYTGVTEPFEFGLYDGDYTLKFWALDPHTRDSLKVQAEFYYITPVLSRNNNIRNNQVFYTSFEYDTYAVTPQQKAGTGEKAYNKALDISLKNMKIGSYILSYWKSTDNGASWDYVENPLEVNSSSQKYTLGSTAYLIDEVRLFPKNASLTSFTSIAGIGKTSGMDTNGLAIYYEYDNLGRLVRVLDHERKVNKGYEYYVNFK